MNTSAKSSSVSATVPFAGSAASSKDARRKTYMPITLKVTVLSGTSRQNTGIVISVKQLVPNHSIGLPSERKRLRRRPCHLSRNVRPDQYGSIDRIEGLLFRKH